MGNGAKAHPWLSIHRAIPPGHRSLLPFPALCIFLGDDLAHRGGGIGVLLGAHASTGGLFPQCGCLPAHGHIACVDAARIPNEGGGVGGSDINAGGGSDGILVGSEEEELPLVGVRLLEDFVGDVLPGELRG